MRLQKIYLRYYPPGKIKIEKSLKKVVIYKWVNQYFFRNRFMLHKRQIGGNKND